MSEESTTPDLVELMGASRDAANRRDFDALMGFWAPDAVFDATRTAGEMFEGRETIRSFAQEWLGAYEVWELLAFDELLDVGNGVVFAVVRQKARAVGTTGYVRQREGWVWLWVEGLIASVTPYPEADIDEARAAAERLAEERG